MLLSQKADLMSVQPKFFFFLRTLCALLCGPVQTKRVHILFVLCNFVCHLRVLLEVSDSQVRGTTVRAARGKG